MKKYIIITILIITGGAMCWRLVANKKEIDSRKEIKASGSGIAVSVINVSQREATYDLDLVGKTEANQEVIVASEASGKITEINFKLGDHVTKGAVLAKVDDRYKKLAVENARLTHDKYKEDYHKYKTLHDGDAVTEMQMRDMKMAYENSVIQLEQAERQLEDTRIIAPFSGYITSRDIELGTFVNVSSPVAGIADLSQLKITLSVPETDVYELERGQKVSITTAIYPDAVFSAIISHISPKGDQTHSYPIEIAMPNSAKYPLRTGTFVQVNLSKGDTRNALMIPRDAIVSSVKAPSVYIVADGKARLQRIVTGNNYGGYLEVLEGLKDNDIVVVNGQINLMDGSKVSIIRN